MGTHYSVRDYCPCFFAAACGAITFRLLSVCSRDQGERVTLPTAPPNGCYWCLHSNLIHHSALRPSDHLVRCFEFDLDMIELKVSHHINVIWFHLKGYMREVIQYVFDVCPQKPSKPCLKPAFLLIFPTSLLKYLFSLCLGKFSCWWWIVIN